MSAALQFIICTLLVLTSHAEEAAKPPGSSSTPTTKAVVTAVRPSIIAIGDGLTEAAFFPNLGGWGSLLAGNYTRKADVVNRGYGGYYTPWLVNWALPDMFSSPRPLLAIVFLGLKDSLQKNAAGEHYISPDTFGAHISTILEAGKEAGVTRFLLITPPPVCEPCRRAKSPPPWDRSNNHTSLYVAQLSRLAATTPGAALLDIFNGWAATPDWASKYLLPDNLHLSEAGNKALWWGISAALEKHMPEVLPRNLPWVLPPQSAIDIAAPEAAFQDMQQQDAGRGVSTPSSVARGLMLPGGSGPSSSTQPAAAAGGGGTTSSITNGAGGAMSVSGWRVVVAVAAAGAVWACLV